MHPGNWIGVGAAGIVVIVLLWTYFSRRSKS